MTRTGLELERYANPCSYVVANDLVDVRDFVDGNAGELQQWRLRDELGPCTLALCAILLYFRGLRGGRDGCGAQLAVDDWCRVLGRSERAVQYAIRAGVERGFLAWRHRFVPHVWRDEAGVRRQRVQVCSVLYLTAYGARRLERRGETRRAWVRWGSVRLGLVVCGAAEKLWATLREKLRYLARRVTDAADRCTPSLVATPEEENLYRPSFARLVDNPPDPPSGAKVSPSGTHSGVAATPPNVASSKGAQPAGLRGEGEQSPHQLAALALERDFEDLWRRRAFSPATAWPELWAKADEKGRAFLTAQFAKWRPHLARRLEAESAARAGEPWQRPLL